MDSEKPAVSALLVSQDLFFTSRITGTAEGLGYRIELADNIDVTSSAIQDNRYSCIIVDLGSRDVHLADLMRLLPADSQIPVIAFGAHVNTVRLQEARDAGCTEVLSKGRFSASLPEILKRYLPNPD